MTAGKGETMMMMAAKGDMMITQQSTTDHNDKTIMNLRYDDCSSNSSNNGKATKMMVVLSMVAGPVAFVPQTNRTCHFFYFIQMIDNGNCYIAFNYKSIEMFYVLIGISEMVA